MKKIFFSFLVVLFFGVLGYEPGQLVAQENSILDKYVIIDCNTGEIVSSQQLKYNIRNYDIIYVLESHGRAPDHLLQKEIIENSVAGNKEMMFANEHLRKNAYDHRMWMDLYREGIVSFDQLKKNVNVVGMYPEMEPLFRLVGDLAIETLPLNIPIPYKEELEIISPNTVTVKSLRKKLLSKRTPEEGFYTLSDRERAFLPKDGFKTLVSNKLYNYVFGSFSRSTRNSDTSNMFVGYCIMNEVMARSITDVFDEPQSSNFQMVVCAGINHGIFNEGIRRSVAERRPDLKQVTILPLSEDWLIRDLEKKRLKLTHENAINLIKKEKFADYVVFYQQDSPTTDEFKAQVNKRIREIGESIGLELKYPVDCKIVGPFKALRKMGYSYNSSIRGLYYENVLYFIEREGKKVTIEGGEELKIHEGTHALQDQYFDLKRLHKIQEKSSADKSAAIKAVIEGHAVYVMIHHSDNPHVAKMLEQPFVSKRTGRLVPQEKILEYRYGGGLIRDLYKEGGWDLANSVFERLPESTEQIMHYKKYLTNEKPLTVGSIATPDGHELINEMVYGEISTLYALLEGGVPEEEALKAAEGWNGDRVFLYEEEKTGDKKIYWATFWDTEEDVFEFFETYRNITTKNWGVEPQIETNEDGSYIYTWEREGNRRSVIVYLDNLNINILLTIKEEQLPQSPHSDSSGGCPSKK